MRRYAILSAVLCAAAAVLLVALTHQDGSSGDLDRALSSITTAEIRGHVRTLAAAEMGGRESGMETGHRAALYVAQRFEESHLEPGGQEGTYFQGFGEGGEIGTLPRTPAREANFLEVPTRHRGEQETVYLGDGLTILSGSPDGRVEGTLEATATTDERVSRGTIALWVAESDPAAWRAQVETFAQAGAEAVVVCTSRDGANLEGEDGALPVPAVVLWRAASERVLATRGRSLENARGFRVRGAVLATQREGPVGVGFKNVIGIRRGSGEATASEYVVIGAHYDHVGMGNWGSRGQRGRVHLGADDNASGTSALLAIARAIPQVTFERTVVLAAFDAEERGLWGSRAFVAQPPEGLTRCVGMVNLDMIGRSDNGMLSIGLTDEASPVLVESVRETEERFRLTFDRSAVTRDDLLRRSDHWSFGSRGTPAMWFFTGLHADYHTERDTPEKLNYDQIERMARMALFAAARMAAHGN